MSVAVTIWHEKPMNIMAIVQELRDYGYTQKTHFDFNYVPASSDFGYDLVPRHTIFTFYEDSIASWFALKYA